MDYLKKFHLFYKMQLICLVFLFPLTAIDIELSQSDENSLKQFLHASCWGSEVGYVLFGNKPICFEGCAESCTSIFTVGHHMRTSFYQGLKIWKKLQLPFEFSNILFIEQKEEGQVTAVLFVNKSAFRKTFKKNKVLFRYKLGFQTTANRLLKSLTTQHFDSLLKRDNILIGLLLGYGFENSLQISRLEKLKESLDSHKTKHELPSFFPNHKACQVPFRKIDLEPGLNFSSLHEENEAIEKNTCLVSPQLTEYAPKLYFARVKNCKENDGLIEQYENTQLELLETLDHPDWFVKVLSAFYNEPVHIKRVEDLTEKDILLDVDWSTILSQIFIDSLIENCDEQDDDNTKLHAFIHGLECADKMMGAHHLAPFPLDLEERFPHEPPAFLMGFKTWGFYKFNGGLFSLSEIIKKLLSKQERIELPTEALMNLHWKIFENIDKYEHSISLSHFQNMNKNSSSFKCLAVNKLYYEQMKHGNGKSLEKKSIIPITFTLKTIHGQVIDKKENYSLDVRRAILGFRCSLPNMREGEKGILYIHPKWGVIDYFTPPYFSPFLIAEFEILET